MRKDAGFSCLDARLRGGRRGRQTAGGPRRAGEGQGPGRGEGRRGWDGAGRDRGGRRAEREGPRVGAGAGARGCPRPVWRVPRPPPARTPPLPRPARPPPRPHGRRGKVKARGAADHPSAPPALPPHPCPRGVNKPRGPHPAQRGPAGREGARPPRPGSPAPRAALLLAPPAAVSPRAPARLRARGLRRRQGSASRGRSDTWGGGVSRRTVRPPRDSLASANRAGTTKEAARPREGRLLSPRPGRVLLAVTTRPPTPPRDRPREVPASPLRPSASDPAQASGGPLAPTWLTAPGNRDFLNLPARRRERTRVRWPARLGEDAQRVPDSRPHARQGPRPGLRVPGSRAQGVPLSRVAAGSPCRGHRGGPVVT